MVGDELGPATSPAEIPLTYNQFMTLMHVRWPNTPVFWDLDTKQHFLDWLLATYGCTVRVDGSGNWRALIFEDPRRATEFVLRYVN